MADRIKDLAQIHALKRQLGLDDETYRVYLHRETGHTSSANLTEKQRSTLITIMRSGLNGSVIDHAVSPKIYKQALSRRILSEWIKLRKAGAVKKFGDKAMHEWCAKHLDKEVNNIDWLEKEDASKCVEGLKYWLKRVTETEATNTGTK